ncbi:unnamed protein product [Euphydryas editha]|uniref:Uncharacterized protein n=1 Tax=Euphydryas editha TaxID=104508 RepID=A0AAU9UZA4_EUPED|nr:unnamed protein product [Euphydryas editha]
MQHFFNRLVSLEEQYHTASSQRREPSGGAPTAMSAAAVGAEHAVKSEPASAPQGCARLPASVAPSSPERPVSATADHFSVADRIVDALRFINIPVRSNQSYYFDPNVNDIETWCEKVDRPEFSVNLKKCSFLSTKIECLRR